MPAIGWLASVAAADLYFLESRLSSPYWTALTILPSKDEKTAVLKQAYNRIRLSKHLSIPASPTAAQLDKLAIAQCEMAYYLAAHLSGEDKRKGIQAQGVVGAGVVKESYSEAKLDAAPFPAGVMEWLDEFVVTVAPFYALEIGRDEDEAIDYDPTDEE